MSEVTQLIEAISQGDKRSAEQLLPLVYDELRRLAAGRIASERPGQTLQATALVHEAYLRLVGDDGGPQWDGRAHFFGAAAEAMRRILVDAARRKARLKHGGERQRVDLNTAVHPSSDRDAQMLAVNDLLDELAGEDAGAAEVVKLRYFAGYTLEEAADLLGISRSTVQRRWNFARAWLFSRLPAASTPTPDLAHDNL
jgi:RNA polymerase sigma factor (TIGR02999 family)